MIFQSSFFFLIAQNYAPPLPVEVFAGHSSMYYQMILKRNFSPKSKFAFFGLASYNADYKNKLSENSLVTITQISYQIAKGFGVMAGVDINSFSGFSPIVGPQHNYASKNFLAVTLISFFLNKDKDFKFFGLYEYTPSINSKWLFYSRLQLVYNHSLLLNAHNMSYAYLRAGLQHNSFIFGLGANIDWSGSNKAFGDNYGGFVRWEF